MSTRIDQKIEQLKAQLQQLEQEKQEVQIKEQALQDIQAFVEDKLQEAGLDIGDLLALYEKDVLKYQKKGQKKERKARKATKPNVKTVVTVPGLGHFEIGMRGKLPDALKTFMEKSNLDRQGLIEKYAD